MVRNLLVPALLLALLVLLVSLGGRVEHDTWSPAVVPPIVELDPGHGGGDGGALNVATGGVLHEKDVNLAVALATQAKLQAQGFTVYLTRDVDRAVDRDQRIRKASGDGAQVVLSIHHNAHGDPTLNYTATYYTQRSDRWIARLAQDKLVEQLGFRSRGIQHDTFDMTAKPEMPSALTEAWFVTNDALARRYLADPDLLIRKESKALADAIAAYFGDAR